MKKLTSLILFFLVFPVILCGCDLPDKTLPPPMAEIGGISYEAGADSVSVSTPEEMEELISYKDFFDYLKTVDISKANLTPAEIGRLEEEFPAARIDYTVSFCGKEYDGNIRELDLSGADPRQAAKEAPSLARFISLEKINIIKEDSSCEFSDDDYIALKRAAPDAEIEYVFNLFGQKLNTVRTTELRYKNEEIGDDGLKEFRKALPYASALTYLSLDDCGTTDEEMAKLRDEFPDTKIVWRVYYGTGLGNSCMTDTEKIWSIGNLGTDPEDTAGLYYCTDVKYMDIGHNSVTNIDFLYNMPNLEVLIIACGEFNDVTAVGSLENLEYLEVGETHVKDISPLVNCQKLEHLHVGGGYEMTDDDIMPLLGLKNLKRLNCANMSNPEFHSDKMLKLFREAMPDTELIFGNIYGSSFWGEWRYGDGPDGYAPRYALLREQIGYP